MANSFFRHVAKFRIAEAGRKRSRHTPCAVAWLASGRDEQVGNLDRCRQIAGRQRQGIYGTRSVPATLAAADPPLTFWPQAVGEETLLDTFAMTNLRPVCATRRNASKNARYFRRSCTRCCSPATMLPDEIDFNEKVDVCFPPLQRVFSYGGPSPSSWCYRRYGEVHSYTYSA